VADVPDCSASTFPACLLLQNDGIVIINASGIIMMVNNVSCCEKAPGASSMSHTPYFFELRQA
jgi:hypothetical protein